MTQSTEWRALVTLPRPDDPTIGQLDVLTRTLPGFAIVADDGTRLRAELTVEASTLRQATDAALRAVRGAAAAAGIAEATQLRVLPAADFDEEIARPGGVDLVGQAEAAQILGVSQQRVDQLDKEHPDFPAPLARLRMGPVWTRASIEAFNTRWERRPGRPRKART